MRPSPPMNDRTPGRCRSTFSIGSYTCPNKARTSSRRYFWLHMVQMAVERAAGATSLIDALDRILDKGIVLDAWVRPSLVGIDLIAVEARVIVVSAETASSIPTRSASTNRLRDRRRNFPRRLVCSGMQARHVPRCARMMTTRRMATASRRTERPRRLSKIVRYCGVGRCRAPGARGGGNPTCCGVGVRDRR